jgi:hypothetical protein
MNAEIPFEDNKGNVIRLDENLTIADLVKMGVKDIRLIPEDSPLPDNWWRDAGSPNDQGHGRLPATESNEKHNGGGRG